MTLPAAILLLTAAAAHAAWNFLGKRRGSGAGFFLVANTAGTLALSAPVLFYPRARESFSSAVFTADIWGWIALTGLFQALYYLGLASAYRTGDLSLAYPLLRSVPVVLVALANLALGKAAQISPLALAGIGMVAAGALLLPMRGFGGVHTGTGLIPASMKRTSLVSGWALFTALNTVGYSLVDDHALRLLRAEAASGLGVTLVYAFWEGLAASLWLGVIVSLKADERDSLFSTLRQRLGSAVLTGLGVYLAYTLVLVAMGFVRNVSYVVAFRQTSILLAALLGMTVLKEPAYKTKVLGVGLLFFGLVLVGLG